MAILIPEAQTQFSPVEQPRANPGMATAADGIGALADLGVQWQAQKVKVEGDRAVRSARLTAMEGLDTLRQQYEQDSNLNGLTDRWAADAAAVTKAASDQLPAHLRADFDLSMQEMTAPQTSQIRRREYALYQDQERAALNADMRRYETTAAAAPDQKGRDAILTEAAADIGRLVDSGVLTAVEADQMMSNLPASVARAAAVSALNDDPAGYLERDAAHEFDALPPQERARNSVMAKGMVASKEVRRLKEDQLVAAAADKELSDKVTGAIKIIDSGVPFAGLPDLMAEAAGTPYGELLQGAVDASSTAGNFAVRTLAEQAAEIARLAAIPTKDPAEVGRRNRLQSMHENTRKSLETDPLAHVRDRRIMPVEPVDITDPASVARRLAEAETIYREYTPGAPAIRYFDNAEAKQYAAILSGADPDAALGVVATIANTFGDRAPAALAQLGEKDPVAYLAGSLLLQTGDPLAGRTVLAGRALAKEGKGAKLASEVRRAVSADLSVNFPSPSDPRFTTLMDAADAHFAATGFAVADPKSPEAKAAYLASVQAVSAGTTQNGVSYGGIQPVNGKDALLPADLTARNVEHAVVYFPAAAWTRASVSGQLPKGFDNFSPRDRENWTLMSLKDGSYAVGYRTASGTISYLTDDGQKDGIFRLDLHTLVKGVPAQ